jgi:His/Glu/Gln/Arg/opine family amino acid ABC transporter permease subunit
MNNALQPILQAWPAILAGAELTILGSVIGIILAMLLAIPAGFGRLSRNAFVRSVSGFYIETIRGTPLLLQLLIWYYGMRILLLALFNFNADVAAYNLLSALNSNTLYPQAGISSFFFAILGLSFNYGAYLAEVIRAGILAVDAGQTEAALSLGFSRFQVSRLVVLPQALRLMVPPLTNNFITLVQDTSFFQVLGVYELSLVVQGHTEGTSSTVTRWEFYVVELAIYFAICYSLSLISRRWQTTGALKARRRRIFFLPGGTTGQPA